MQTSLKVAWLVGLLILRKMGLENNTRGLQECNSASDFAVFEHELHMHVSWG